MKKCKRGNISKRDKWGHCLCDDCKKYKYLVQRNRPNIKEYAKNWARNNKGKIYLYVKKWNDANKEKRAALSGRKIIKESEMLLTEKEK